MFNDVSETQISVDRITIIHLVAITQPISTAQLMYIHVVVACTPKSMCVNCVHRLHKNHLESSLYI